MGRIGYCREHILDSGLSVLLKKGYNGTGVKDIVDAAGVPKGSFYNHFTSKEAFVIETIDKVSKASLEQAKAILSDESLPPKVRLVKYFESACQQLTDSEFKGGCLIGNLSLEMADESEAIRDATAKVMCAQIKLFEDCLAQAKTQGELDKSIDTHELAEFIYYAWEGAIMRGKSQRDCHAFSVFKNQLERFFG